MSTAKERLLDAAERLVAERGIEVSSRDIAAAAGQRNNSAVQYHFGSRDALHEAVIRRRQVPLEARRRELLDALAASGRLDDTHSLVDVLVRPMTELLAAGASHYARFLEQVRRHPVLSTPVAIDADWAASQEVMHRLGRDGVRRGQALATTLFALLADAERDGHAPDPDDLVAMLVGLLTAPARNLSGAGAVPGV